MNRIRINRRVRNAAIRMEWLESRRLLSATVTAQIPAQNISVGYTATPISLATYFNDPTVTGTAVVLQTNLGNIPLVLTDSATPQTVANFEQYITSGEYANTIIHRSVPGFIIQGGGFDTNGTQIQSFGTIPGEASTATLKNTTGTIAMALSNGPNSATSNWYINLADNPSLDEANPQASDYDGGPFTAFGTVVYNGMSVVNAIAALPIINDSTQSGAWSTLPVQSGTDGATVTSEPASNLVTVNPEILPGGLTYSVLSSNPSLVTATVDASGNLTLVPGSGGGTANITVTATDMGGGTAASTFAADVTNSSNVVTIGANGGKSSFYTDSSSGAAAVVTLKGGGTATLTFAGTGISQSTSGKGIAITGSGLGLSTITTSGTTAASVLSITSHGGSGSFNVGSLTTDALKSFHAKGVSLTGDLTSSSTIGMLTIAGASGGMISAVSIGKIDVGDAFSDGLSLTAPGQSLNSLTVKGDFSGTVTAGSVGKVMISGAASNAKFDLSSAGTDLSKLTVKGVFSSSTINAAGDIGAITAQALVNGEIYAGVGTLSNDMVLPASASDFAAAASITSVKLKTTAGGDSFINSDIAATTLGKLTLGTLQTSNDGTPTGVVGKTLKSLTATANKKFTLKSKTTSTTIASILAADGVVLGDLVIELLPITG